MLATAPDDCRRPEFVLTADRCNHKLRAGDPAISEVSQRPVVVIASGSIAATNLPGLCFKLRQATKRDVIAVLSDSARRFVTRDAVSQMGGASLVLEQGMEVMYGQSAHIWLAESVVGVVVYPASASFIGKIAAGIGMDLASTAMLALADLPMVIAPAMHIQMWRNPFVQENLKQLRSKGMHIVSTDDGLSPDLDTVVAAFCDHLGSRRDQANESPIS